MADQDNKEESQKWLTYLETSIEEQQDERDVDSEAAYYEAVRDMLLDQGDSDKAISQAIERCYNHYIKSIDTENARFEEDGMKGPHKYDIILLKSIAVVVFETSTELPYPDHKTEILAQFLIRMAKNIPSEFRYEGADTTRDFDGIQIAARESWEPLHADRFDLDKERPDAEEIAHAWLNSAALIAKLFQADLLDGYGSMWVSHDLVRTFERRTQGDITKHILKQSQVLAVANYIIFADDALAKALENKKFTESRELTAEKWQNWTSKLQEMADAVDEDVRWDLKERLQKAHDKMVEMQQLYIDGADSEQRESPEYGAGYKLNSIADVVFQVVRDVFYTSLEHDRLANLLIGIKKGAAADESWNAGHVDAFTKNLNKEPEHIWPEAWINKSALISKLYRGGLLDSDGLIGLSWDFEMAFEKRTSGDVTSDAGRQAQVLAPINHMLVAGKLFVDEAKANVEGREFQLDAMKWRLWASKVKGVADAVGESARWDLKSRAQTAHEKMIKLYPEAFE
ncbi:hypothetical protein FSPOR_6690 [Fusarium sporotrichioides]|uniref:PH domain-containing protein n=1 Tax=Fusarium sporotrichioides TaxID=5514 RepID=A0A395S2I2_FUSSP|nr:hypothetical protein FSPOR_6690 [Fusarium sporotrichioides]